MFNVDFVILMNWINITFLRKEKFIALILAYISPVVDRYEHLVEFRNKINYRLNHNGQVCYLEAMLNDHFDETERRIYIIDGEINTGTFIYTPGENQPLFLPEFIYSYDDWFLNGEYFIVVFPIGFDIPSNKTLIKNLLDTYKLVTKKYILRNG